MLPDNDQHPVDKLAEEFAERIRAGETPHIEEYCRTYPEHAETIRSVFPSVQMIERAGQREEQHRRSDDRIPSPSLVMPQSLGDYLLIREIGRGGMGVVYEAEQQSLKRRVALKVISSQIAGSQKQLKRFRREAESAASLHHSNIVPVYGIGEDHGLQYYAMQLIDGVTLAEVIHQLNMAPQEVLSTATDRSSFDTKPVVDQPSDRFSAMDAVLQLFWTTKSANVQELRESGLSADSSLLNPPVAVRRSGVQTSVADIRKSARQESGTSREGAAPAEPHRNQLGRSRALPLDTQICSGKFLTSPPSREIQDVLPEEELRLSPAYIRNIARAISNVANAVHYAHHQGVLHRDVKPANLILDREGTIWVADFGLARHADLVSVTQTGEIVGTLRYMAPEQLNGKSDVRSDVYALGLTLYELLVLKPALDAPQFLNGRTRESVKRLRSSRPEIPADLETITLKACAVEPERRYQTAREFEADLVRFLEDRPIMARRVTSVERLWRWSRRNPIIASLSTATLLLLATIVMILGISNHRIQRALVARNTEYERAEQNLSEKTTALANVERERVRAETNLELAISAFEEVIKNIAARGRSESFLEDLGEDDLQISADAVLSSADVILLETLLSFFDRLAAKNSKDLSTESAAARRRVGDIQQQLGRFEDAQQSYQRSLDAYQTIATRNPEDASLVFSQAEILHQMMMTSAKREMIPDALTTFQNLRTLLATSPAVQQSAHGRFTLATAINSLVAFGLPTAVEPRNRIRNPLFNRMQTALELPAPALRQRLRREIEANKEALSILKQLTTEEPSSVAYRLALAQATKDSARIAQLSREWSQADEALAAAISIIEGLQQEFPDADRFKFELAETLSTITSFRPGDLQRLTRSRQLCRELVEAHPRTPEYRSLYAATLARIAGLQVSQGKSDLAESTLQEALTHYQQLADEFPDVLMYQIALVRTQQQLSHIYTNDKRTELAKKSLDAAIKQLEKLPVRNNGRNPANLILNRMKENRSKLGDG
jgi:serine/threonine protein kinase